MTANTAASTRQAFAVSMSRRAGIQPSGTGRYEGWAGVPRNSPQSSRAQIAKSSGEDRSWATRAQRQRRSGRRPSGNRKNTSTNAVELPRIQVWRPTVVSACSDSGDQPSRRPSTASPIDNPVNA